MKKRLFFVSKELLSSTEISNDVSHPFHFISAKNGKIDILSHFPYIGKVSFNQNSSDFSVSIDGNEYEFFKNFNETSSPLFFITNKNKVLNHTKFNISKMLSKNLQKWFIETNNDNDIKIMIDLASSSEIKNTFSQDKSDYKSMFKWLILNIRPRGRPNVEFATQNYYYHLFGRNFNIFKNQFNNFVETGINYILGYAKNSSEWGSYSVISYRAFLEGLKSIKPLSISGDYNEVDQHIFFDGRNMKIIRSHPPTLDFFIWSYNVYFHNSFKKLIKYSQQLFYNKNTSLLEIIKIRILSSKDASSENFKDFYLFLEAALPEYPLEPIFQQINNEIECMNSSEKYYFNSFQVFYSNTFNIYKEHDASLLYSEDQNLNDLNQEKEINNIEILEYDRLTEMLISRHF